jgi:hypothetical protein
MRQVTSDLPMPLIGVLGLTRRRHSTQPFRRELLRNVALVRVARGGEALRERVRRGVRAGLIRVGAAMPGRLHYEIEVAADYLHLGRWLAGRGLRPRLHMTREEVFDHAAALIADRRVLYLEFGVADGRSLLYWSRLLSHPEAELHAFDSFEGLPEDWIEGMPAGTFGRGGQPPDIDDPRIRLHVGLFAETLPKFEWPNGWEVLVVNFDADLYSSTREALALVETRLAPGSILYFDELNHRYHEVRAFEEFLKETGHSVDALGATRDRARMAFRVR